MVKLSPPADVCNSTNILKFGDFYDIVVAHLWHPFVIIVAIWIWSDKCLSYKMKQSWNQVFMNDFRVFWRLYAF